MMLYSEPKLSAALNSEENRTFLESAGYTSGMSLSNMLERLSGRIERCGGFPHEIGVFLGYPVEDVQGFIDNDGSNYKLCGYWKVYGNERSARRTFSNYDKCRRFLCGRLDEGMDFYCALKLS